LAPTTSSSTIRAASAPSVAIRRRSGSKLAKTAPGAFEDAADFERNDVVEKVEGRLHDS
jgi:hypothetical protein